MTVKKFAILASVAALASFAALVSHGTDAFAGGCQNERTVPSGSGTVALACNRTSDGGKILDAYLFPSGSAWDLTIYASHAVTYATAFAFDSNGNEIVGCHHWPSQTSTGAGYLNNPSGTCATRPAKMSVYGGDNF